MWPVYSISDVNNYNKLIVYDMRTYGSVIYDSRYSDRLIGVYVAGSRLYAVRQF